MMSFKVYFKPQCWPELIMLNILVAESEEGAPKLLIQWLSSGGKLIQNILNEQCEYFIDLPICRHCDLSGFIASGVGFHVDCCGRKHIWVFL